MALLGFLAVVAIGVRLWPSAPPPPAQPSAPRVKPTPRAAEAAQQAAAEPIPEHADAAASPVESVAHSEAHNEALDGALETPLDDEPDVVVDPSATYPLCGTSAQVPITAQAASGPAVSHIAQCVEGDIDLAGLRSAVTPVGGGWAQVNGGYARLSTLSSAEVLLIDRKVVLLDLVNVTVVSYDGETLTLEGDEDPCANATCGNSEPNEAPLESDAGEVAEPAPSAAKPRVRHTLELPGLDVEAVKRAKPTVRSSAVCCT